MTFLDTITLILNHPLFANSVIIALGTFIGTLFLKRSTKKAQTEINQRAKEVEYEIQRKYMLTEIRVRHVLEIYPKLYDSVLTAATPYVTLFSTINDRIEEIKNTGNTPSEIQLRQFIISGVFGEDSLQLKINDVGLFNNLLASSGLFISDEVNTILIDMKKEVMNLFRLIRKEIASDAYKGYNKKQLFDLIDRANISTSSLDQDKERLARRMNKELRSCSPALGKSSVKQGLGDESQKPLI